MFLINLRSEQAELCPDFIMDKPSTLAIQRLVKKKTKVNFYITSSFIYIA